jgi:hypothetical protein
VGVEFTGSKFEKTVYALVRHVFCPGFLFFTHWGLIGVEIEKDIGKII